MVLQVNEKYKIKYDAEEKQYIYYRIMDKSEMAAHMAEANKQIASMLTTKETFQQYIDDERVKPTTEEELGLPS